MLDELRHFIWIAETGTLTEAARKAHLSQPALSASLRRLESYFEASLFHRGRMGAELTAAGESLVPHARAILSTLEGARRKVAEVSGLRSGEVRIGAGATACTYLLPKHIATYRRRYPGVRFRLSEMTTDEAEDAVHDGLIDIAVVSHPDGPKGEVWMEDRLILIASPKVAGELSGKRLTKQTPFLTFREGTTTRDLHERTFSGSDIVMELASIAAVKGNVRAGTGVALVSEHAVEDDLRRGRLVQIRHRKTPLRRQFYLHHRGEGLLSPAVAAFRSLLLATT